jgi:hypothetical protein
MANATPPEDPDFKVLMQALAIISETNKHVNSCLNRSYNTAKIKIMEQHLSIKASKSQPTLPAMYATLVKEGGQYVEECPVEIMLRHGIQKKSSGLLSFFTNMVLVCVAQRGTIHRTKRLYTIPYVRLEEISNSILQLTALQPPEDGSEEGPEVPNSSTRFRCETTQLVRDIIDRVHQLKEATQANRTFGVGLNVIIDREGLLLRVPLVLQTLCEYIMRNCTFPWDQMIKWRANPSKLLIMWEFSEFLALHKSRRCSEKHSMRTDPRLTFQSSIPQRPMWLEWSNCTLESCLWLSVETFIFASWMLKVSPLPHCCSCH